MSFEEEFEEENQDKKTSMADLARKILLTGVGAIFMTEGGVRKSLSDLKLPKDTVINLVENVRKQKDELIKMVTEEIAKFLSHIKVHEEMQKALSGMEVHIDAKVTFSQSGKSSKNQIKLKTKTKS
ncbi:MAG: hypothetical protein H7A32_03305 [Deltaproteobacteria bacterium]|nr:hypothetical protein [Deltaproteobacteria bacterium]